LSAYQPGVANDKERRRRPAKHGRRPTAEVGSGSSAPWVGPVLDNGLVGVEVKRPDHLEDQAWQSIEVHVNRFEMARQSSDAGWAIGSAKDLVECVARVVLDAKGVVIPANADFDE
jgi:hypothetical protein